MKFDEMLRRRDGVWFRYGMFIGVLSCALAIVGVESWKQGLVHRAVAYFFRGATRP